MEYLIICVVCLVTSALTLFSGFGLGTLLLPAFALFFPVDVAVGLTAIVHFLNNLFKLSFDKPDFTRKALRKAPWCPESPPKNPLNSPPIGRYLLSKENFSNVGTSSKRAKTIINKDTTNLTGIT